MSASGFLVLDSASASSSVVANSDEEADGAQSPFVILHSPVQVNWHGRALPGGSGVPAAAQFGGLSPARTPSPHRNGTGSTINDADGKGAQPQHPQPQRQPYDPTSSQFDPDSRRADSILHGGGVWADMGDVGDVDDAPVTGLALPDPRTERCGPPPGTASTASTTGAAPGPSLGAGTVAAVAPVRWSRSPAGSMGGDVGAAGPDGAAAGRSSGIWAASASAAVAEAPPPPPPPPLPPDRAAAAAAEPAGAWDTLPADTRAMSSGNSSSRSRNTVGDNEGPEGEGMGEADGGGDEDDDAGGALGLLGGLDEAALRSIPPALLQLLQQLEEERDELAGRLLESDAELSALRASYQQLSHSHASSQTWLNQLLCQQLELHERRQRRRSRRQYSDQPVSGAPAVVPAAAPAVEHVEEDGREEEPEEDVTGETGLEPEEEDIAAEGDLPTHGTATEGAAQQQQQPAVAAEDVESDDGGRAAATTTAAAPRERELPPPLLSRAAVAADEAAVGEDSDSSGVIAGARASDGGAGETGGAVVAAARATAPGVELVAAVELAAASGSGDSGRHGRAAEGSGSGRAGCGSPDRGSGRGVGRTAIVDSSCEGSAGAGADANEPPSASIASAAAVSPAEPAVEAQTELEAAATAGAGAAAGAQPEAMARPNEEEAEAEVSQVEAEAEAAAQVIARPAARSAAAEARATGWALKAVQEEEGVAEEGVAEEVVEKVAEEEEPPLAHTASAASSDCGGLRQPQPQTVHQGQRQLRQRARAGHETETSGGESDLRSQPAAPKRAGAALRPAGASAAPEPPPGRLPLPGLALGLVAVAAVVLLLLAAGGAVLLRGLSRESGFGASGRQLIPGSPHPVQAGHVAVPGKGQPAAALRGASAGPKLNPADNKADPNAATSAVRGAQGSLEPSGDDPAGAAHTAAAGALAFGAGAEEPDDLGFGLGTVFFYYQDPEQQQPQQQPELGQESKLSPSHGADAEATGQGEEQDQGQEQGVGRWHWPGLGEGAEALGAMLAHGGQLQASLEPKALEVEVAGHGEGWPAPAGQPAAAGAAASAAAVAATATATATAAAGNVAADAASTCAGAADYVVADVATKVAIDSAAAVAALRATAATAAASAATPAPAPAAIAGPRAGARRNTPLPPLSTSAPPPGLMAAIGPRAAPPPQPDCLALGCLSEALCYEAPGGIADPDLDPDVDSEHGRRSDRRQTRGPHRGGRREAAASGDTAGGGAPDAACRALAAARALPPGAVQPRAVAVRAAMVGLEERWRRFAHEVTAAAAAAAAGTETHGRKERRHRRRRRPGGDADAGDANAASASASQVVASWAAAHWLPRLQRHVRSVADDDELPEAMATAHKVVALASRLCSETGYDLANLTAPLRQRLEAALGDMAAVTTVHVDAAYSGGAADVEAALAEAGRCLDWLAARTAEEEAVATCRRACKPRAQLLDAVRQLGLPSSLLDRDLNLGRPDLNLGLDLGLDLDHHLDAIRSLLGPDSVLQKKLRNLDLQMDQHLDPYVSSLLGPDSALRKALRAGASLTDRLRDRIKPVVAGAAATAAAAVAAVRQVIEQQGSALACGCGTSGSRAAGAAGAGFTNDTVAAQWCSRGLEALMKRARQAAVAVGDDPMAGDRRQERRRHDGDCQRQAREGGRRENKCDDTQSESIRRGASASASAFASASAGGRQRDGEWAFEGLSAAVRQFRDDVAALRTAVAEVRRRCQGAAEGLKAYRQAMRQEL